MDQPYILLMYVQRMIYKRTFEYLDNVGLMSIAAFLEKNRYRARVFTGIVTDAVKVFEEESQERSVFAVGLYCDYDNQSTVEALSLLLKEKYSVKVLIGGPQTIHIGEDFLKTTKCDFLVRGDGEYALLELLSEMTADTGNFSHIKGIAFLDKSGKMVCTPERPLIGDLDSLPAPNSSHLLRRPHKYNLSIVSARGCPFRCTFCFEGGNTKTLRLRSAQSVKEEIMQELDNNSEIKYVWFTDDTFTLDYERTATFCEVMSELRKTWDFVWFCEGHASALTKWPQLINMMKDSGLARMQIGMESGWSPALRMYNKQTTVEQVEEAIHLCWECGLPQLAGNFIIGGVRESRETLEITTAYTKRLLNTTPGLLDISTTFVIPLPNTAISNYPHRFGMELMDINSLTSLEDFPMTYTEELGREDICHERFKFMEMLADTMKSLFKAGKISDERIKRHFELAQHYGVSSLWYQYLYTKDVFVYEYFTMLINTPAKRFEEIPLTELESWYPCRVFNLDDMIKRFNGCPVLNGVELLPIEYELLLLCDGKINLNKIRQMLNKKQFDLFTGNQIYSKVNSWLKKFQNQHWVLFLPA